MGPDRPIRSPAGASARPPATRLPSGTVPGTRPYPWPWDGTLDPARLALVVCGADTAWRTRSAGAVAVAHVLRRLAHAVRAVDGLVVHVHHGAGGARPGGSSPFADPVVSAAGLDGFWGSALGALLRRAGRDQLLVAGFGLEGPVHSTLRAANDRGHECLLVADACAPVDPGCVEGALSTVTMSGGIFGAVGSAASVLAALGDLSPPVHPPTELDPIHDPTRKASTRMNSINDPGAGVVNAEPYPWPYDGRFDLARTALVNIDWQADFCGPGGYVDAMGYDLSLTRTPLAPTVGVLAACREAGMFIVHTREGHRPDLSDCPPNKLWRSRRIGGGIGDTGPCGRMLVRGEPGWDIVAEVHPIDGEVIIDKPGKGSFYATDLDLVLQNRGITHLVLTGITTDVCVHTTMREANDRGYECLLLSDCTGATDHGNYLAALKMIKMQGGVFGAVAPSGAFLRALETTVRTTP